MRIQKLLTTLCAAACAAGAGLPARPRESLERVTPVPADQPVPAIDFFRPPLFSNPKLNADGTMFAALATVGRERSALMIFDITALRYTILDGGGGKDVHSFSWLDRSRVMARLIDEKRYALGLFVSHIRSLDRIDTYAVEYWSVTQTIGVPRNNPLKPILWVRQNAYDDGRDGGVVQIDATRRLKNEDDELPALRNVNREAGGAAHGMRATVVRTFAKPPGGVPVGFLSNLDGELAYAFTRAEGVTTLHRFKDAKWTPTAVDLETWQIVDVSDRDGEFLVLEPGDGTRPRGLQRFDVTTGQPGDVLFHDEAYDLDRVQLVRRPGGGQIVGVGLDRARWENFWFDERYARIQASFEKQFPKECVQILGGDDGEKRFLVAAWSDRKPIAYYLADLEKGSLGLLQSSRPWIDPARMRPMSIVRYKTRDGKEIEGYLTLPEGASKANRAPLVVLPHGGPWVRDSWGWDPAAQFLASRGYAVLQPNYRGSDSYAWRFPAEDLWAFRRMHEDVTDSIPAVKKTGLIDPDRIAIMGGSFGGYLAVCGAAFEPELYRCAVTIAGVFDWERMIREVARIDEGSVRSKSLLRKLGEPSKNRERFDEISPLRHLEDVRVPIFVAHGTIDSVVDVAQSKRLVGELERLGKPHVAHFERGEGHGMAYVDNEVELYTRIEAFLALHLAPRAAP